MMSWRHVGKSYSLGRRSQNSYLLMANSYSCFPSNQNKHHYKLREEIDQSRPFELVTVDNQDYCRCHDIYQVSHHDHPQPFAIVSFAESMTTKGIHSHHQRYQREYAQYFNGQSYPINEKSCQ